MKETVTISMQRFKELERKEDTLEQLKVLEDLEKRIKEKEDAYYKDLTVLHTEEITISYMTGRHESRNSGFISRGDAIRILIDEILNKASFFDLVRWKRKGYKEERS